MSLLVVLFIWILAFAVAVWIVSKAPLPKEPAWLRGALYVIVGLFALIMLLNLVGWIDPFGWHPRLR